MTNEAYQTVFALTWHSKAPSIRLMADSSELPYRPFFCLPTCIEIHPNTVLEADFNLYGGVFTRGRAKGR